MGKKSFMDNKGFSLIELIVAVLIIAIISGGAIIAFNAIYSTEASAAARNVVDALKQARTYALGKENNELVGGRTEVYAKIYYSDSKLNIDVCKSSSVSGATTEAVLHSQRIGDDPFRIKFYEVTSSSGENEPIVMGGSDVVKVYFKKSTGGVAGFEKNIDAIGISTGINKLHIYRASNPGNYQDLVLVNLTGRCYVDQ